MAANEYVYSFNERKNEFDEYVVRCWLNGKRYTEGDYHTSDKIDARRTMEEMVTFELNRLEAVKLADAEQAALEAAMFPERITLSSTGFKEIYLNMVADEQAAAANREELAELRQKLKDVYLDYADILTGFDCIERNMLIADCEMLIDELKKKIEKLNR